MNYKRGRPKNRRGGCLLCKPWKANGAKGRDARPASDERRMLSDDEAERTVHREVGRWRPARIHRANG